MTVCESLAGFPPSTQLAVCQLRHRQDLSLSVRFLVLACSTASTVQIALSDKSCLFLVASTRIAFGLKVSGLKIKDREE